MITIRNKRVLRWFGWKDPLPSYVRAHWKLWYRWRK